MKGAAKSHRRFCTTPVASQRTQHISKYCINRAKAPPKDASPPQRPPKQRCHTAAPSGGHQLLVRRYPSNQALLRVQDFSIPTRSHRSGSPRSGFELCDPVRSLREGGPCCKARGAAGRIAEGQDAISAACCPPWAGEQGNRSPGKESAQRRLKASPQGIPLCLICKDGDLTDHY